MIDHFKKRKRVQTEKRISAITAYDYPTAKLIEEVGVDLILVGDSLGMVVLGFPDTTHVTMAHMLHHISAVRRGAEKTFIVGDLPYNSYNSPEEAVQNAELLIEAGADAVKLEGGYDQKEKLVAIIAKGIPVLGHLGMLPQSVLEEGGYKKKGKSEAGAKRLLEEAQLLESLGCFGVVLESVVAHVAQEVSERISIPTIGIGCGRGTCDGEIAVITDVVGSFPWFVPPFATPYAKTADSIKSAVEKYVEKAAD